MKKFLLSLLCLISFMAINAGTYTYDFSSNSNWVTTSGGSTAVGKGDTNKLNAFYYKNTGECFNAGGKGYFSNGYFLWGKSGAYIEVPTFDGEKITNITAHSSSNHSPNVTVNVLTSDGKVASTQIKWASKNRDYSYDIKDEYQSSVLRLQVTNGYNSQLTKLTITTVTTSGEEPGEGGGEEPGDDPVEPEIPTKGDTYRLVTSNSELEANEKYIIVAAEYYYAMSTTQNTNNRGQNLITKNGNLITLSDESIAKVQVLTLEEGAIANTWAFFTGEKYLYAASSSGNQLKEITTKNKNASASISIDASGVASIVFKGEYTKNTLRYNSSSSLFSCYASGQNDVSLYKFIKTVATPVITLDENDTISITCATKDATIYYTTNGDNPTTSPENIYTKAFKLEGGATVKAIAVKNGWKNSAIATVTFAQVATPEISIDDDDMISITCATEGATIYYTIDGTTPTTSSTQYTDAFKLTVSSLTVNAIAVKDGWKNSTIASEALVPTAIEEVGVDAGEAVYYNLQGVKVANPENGIFIKKQGGRTSKVVL